MSYVSMIGVPRSDHNDPSGWIEYPMNVVADSGGAVKGTGDVVDKAFWRRNGNNIDIRYYYRQTVAGTGGTGSYLFPLPPGFNADPTFYYKSGGVITDDGGRANIVGICRMGDTLSTSGPTINSGHVTLFSDRYMRLLNTNAITSFSSVGSAGFGYANGDLFYEFYASVVVQQFTIS